MVNTAEAAIDAAIAGTGLTRLLSCQVVDAIQDGNLRIVLAGFEPEPVPVSLIHPLQERVPRKTRVFIDYVSDALRKRMSKQV